MGKEGRTHYPVSFLQHGGIFPDVVSSTKVIILLSAGLMPTEARGNYLPEPPYLCETKTYHSLPLDTTCWQLFRPAINTAHFLFFVAEVNMPNYLTTDGLKKFSLLPETPLRPEARGICHICHVVNPALILLLCKHTRLIIIISFT